MNRNRKYDNYIKISGTVVKKDNVIHYIPNPMFGIEINSYQCPDLPDVHRAVVLDDESFKDKFEIGDRILIEGEIQSRNYSRKQDVNEEEVINAVELYQSLFDKLPSDGEPTQFIRKPILWSELFKYNLINNVPADSVLDENQNEIESVDGNLNYVYKLDWNGEVSKELEETIYEILVHDYEKLDPVDPESIFEPDINSVYFSGRVSNEPIFDIDENGSSLKFTVQSFMNYFRGKEKRYSFVEFLSTGQVAEENLGKFTQNSFVKIDGSFKGISEKRTIRIRKVSPSGKARRKKVEIDYLNRFVDVTEIEVFTPSEPKNKKKKRRNNK